MFEKAFYLIFRLYKRQQNNFMEEINCNQHLASFWKRGGSNIVFFFFFFFTPPPHFHKTSINNFRAESSCLSIISNLCVCVCVCVCVQDVHTVRISFVIEYVRIDSLAGSGLWNSFKFHSNFSLEFEVTLLPHFLGFLIINYALLTK